MIARVALTVAVCFLVSCAYVRENNERFFYHKTIRVLNTATTERTKRLCKSRSNKNRILPAFYNTPYIAPGIEGQTIGKHIVYTNYWMIPHEAAHFIVANNQVSQECLEEMFADVLRMLVYSEITK